MKIQVEGSPPDIRALFDNAAVAKEAALNNLRVEILEKELAEARSKMAESQAETDGLKQTLGAAGKKFSELYNGTNALRMELGSKTAYIAQQDAEIQRLKFVMSEPVRLSADQERQIEDLYQDMVKQYNIKPMVLASSDPNKPVSAEHVVSTILNCMGNGDKLGAVKEIRAATGLPLIKIKTLLDRALMAFGCRVNERGSPLPVVGPNADKPVVSSPEQG